MDKLREKRVRGLVCRLNRVRKRQAQKIDILCNDLVGAQRKFLTQLAQMRRVLDFHEAVAGQSNLDNMLESAGTVIQEWIDDANVAVYAYGSFRTHLVDCQILPGFEYEAFEQCFTTETIDHICSSRKCLSLEELLMAGLQASPKTLKPICAVAVPITHCESKGFLLIYRPVEKPIDSEHIKTVCSVMPFLGKLMATCQVPASTD